MLFWWLVRNCNKEIHHTITAIAQSNERTWKTVTNAQNKVSKLARATSSCPFSFLKLYLEPNRCIPRMLAVNINNESRARKVITLSKVLIITQSCSCNAGMKRTSLKIRRRRNERRTDIPVSSFPAHTSITLSNHRKQRRLFSLLILSYSSDTRRGALSQIYPWDRTFYWV